jgi:hypothetical protein
VTESSESDNSDDELENRDERFLNAEEKERLFARQTYKNMKQSRRQERLDKLGINYERLTEFFFDLCLSWCQFLDIETFLFFINGVFLNISKGAHINVSVLKDLDEV